MRRFLLVVLGALLATGLAQAQIINTAHDLSIGSTSGGGTVDTEQICVFCHTPHQDTGTIAPLWNHTDSAAGSYGAYTSTTMDHVAVAISSGGTEVSVLCMSCHDGTVAVTSLHNPPNDWTPTVTAGGDLNATGFLVNNSNMGTSLSNDHPINFAIADGTDSEIATLAVIGAAVPLFGAGANELQCATCHDPHGSPIAEDPLLTVTMTDSVLCTTCHIK